MINLHTPHLRDEHPTLLWLAVTALVLAALVVDLATWFHVEWFVP
jgi:hypothetical protein